jgi:hypothetical protein
MMPEPQTWSQLLAEHRDDPRYQAAFDEQVRRMGARWMGLAPTVGELTADHLFEVLTFDADTEMGERVEVTGVLYRVQHEQRTRKKRITTVEVRTEKRFQTFELPPDCRCVMETPYEKSVREAAS